MRVRSRSGISLLLVIGLLAGCDDNSSSDLSSQSDKQVSSISAEDVGNASLLVSMDFDNDPTGPKLNPENVGNKYPATVTLNSNNTHFENSNAIHKLSNDESILISDINLSEYRTLSFRIKLEEEQPEAYSSIVDGGHFGGRSREPVLVLNPEGELELWRKWFGSSTPNNDQPVKLLGGIKPPKETWLSISLTNNHEGSAVYINGEKVAEGQSINLASNQLSFGAGLVADHQPLQSANFFIDDIRIYSGVLTEPYIAQLSQYQNLENQKTLPAYSPSPSHQIKNVPFDSLTLKWQHGDEFKNNNSFYRIEIAADKDFKQVINEFSTAENSINIGSLQPGQDYFWRVNVFDGTSTLQGPVWHFSTAQERDSSILPEHITVMAYNIWHAGSQASPELGQEYIYEQVINENVDVLLMQESYGYQEALAQRLGFYIKTAASNNNLAVLSRYPIISDLVQCDSGLCGVRLAMPENREMDVYSVWLTSSSDIVNSTADPSYTNERLIELDQGRAATLSTYMTKALKETDNQYRPVIIGGDLNTFSHLDFTEETNYYDRGAMSWPTLLAAEDHGFIDSYREVKPDSVVNTCKTWTPYFKGNPAQGRIDFILYKGDQLTPSDSYCLMSNGHPVLHPSDHGAVITRFDVQEAEWPEVSQ
ncbi:endonuclease/exonuclease/phosphatase family protein [Endozoicomonas sp. 4G]|uniref:endonuclease/exonuclease/phosphatase family protein n=1 Tax=Endozoicomonas sp. 4G TaxID=2872754 RepID=UPI002078A5D1|nr:endonuclease/exonuclease/phosphatase family protein [Endozoicomonas sp. 4G]